MRKQALVGLTMGAVGTAICLGALAPIAAEAATPAHVTSHAVATSKTIAARKAVVVAPKSSHRARMTPPHTTVTSNSAARRVAAVKVPARRVAAAKPGRVAKATTNVKRVAG